MVLIPAGELWMGSDSSEAIDISSAYPQFCSEDWFYDEFPRHKVFVDSFYIDKFEVTFAQFQTFVQTTGYQAEGQWESFYLERSDSICSSCPVVEVSWNDALVYAKWVGKRLPTEAEWEYIANGKEKSLRYPWGNKVDLTKENVQNERGPLPVGSFPPNSYGIYDLGGNAQEWCHDYLDSNYYQISPYKNPQGPETGSQRIIRGGSWSLNAAFYSRTSVRGYFDNSWFTDPTKKSYIKWFGFRCAKSLKN